MITASRLSWLLTPKFVGLLGPSRQQRLHCVCAFCPKICNAWKKEEIDLSSFLSSCRKKKCTEWQRGKITTPELTFHLDALTHSHQSPLENIYTIYLYIHCSLLFWMDLHSSHSEYTQHWYTLEKKSCPQQKLCEVAWMNTHHYILLHTLKLADVCNWIWVWKISQNEVRPKFLLLLQWTFFTHTHPSLEYGTRPEDKEEVYSTGWQETEIESHLSLDWPKSFSTEKTQSA